MKAAFLLALCFTAIFAERKHFFLTEEYLNEINSMQNTWTAGYNERWESFTLESIRS